MLRGCHARASKYPGTTATGTSSGCSTNPCCNQGPSLLYRNTSDLSIVGRSGQHNTLKYQSSQLYLLMWHFYLQHLQKLEKQKTAVDDAVNALAWVHELGGLPSPTSHPTVRAMQESAHRIKGRPKLEKRTSVTTVATRKCQGISPGVSVIVGYTNCHNLSPASQDFSGSTR